MSFTRYAHYKESESDWVAEVPNHWTVEPFKRQIERNDGGVWGEEPDGINDTVVLRSTEQTVDGQWQIEVPSRRRLTESEVDAALLMSGDLLLTKSSGSSLHIGKTTLVTSEVASLRCCYSNFMQRIRTKRSFLPKLAWYVMNNDLARKQFDLLSNSSTGLANLNAGMIGQIHVPVPPLADQIRITDFLDRETAKIDELVAEQRRLMELLKEKRQAVISHAVTKGLDPHAPMKPSGIEWLGDVPDHWKVGKAGFYTRVLSGFAFPSAGFLHSAEGTKLLRGINVGVGRIKWDETVYWKRAVDDGLNIYELRAGDLVIGMDRPWINEGVRVAKVTESDLPCLLLQRVASLETSRDLISDYLMLLLCSEQKFNAHFTPETTGVSVPHISPEQIANFSIPIPPVSEQRAIVEYVARKSSAFAALSAETQRAIDLLQERRTALISAAVTGKIDVRGLAESEAA